MSDFGDVRYPVARKAHKCEWCGEPIHVGERHPQFVGQWDGEFQHWRMHSECYGAVNWDDLVDGFMPYEHARGGSIP